MIVVRVIQIQEFYLRFLFQIKSNVSISDHQAYTLKLHSSNLESLLCKYMLLFLFNKNDPDFDNCN